MAEKRVEIKYSGRVQGVGFRFTAERLARAYRIKGYVKNLIDGGVEVVAEGEEASLKGFLNDIDLDMGSYVDSREMDWDQPKERFGSFEIRF